MIQLYEVCLHQYKQISTNIWDFFCEIVEIKYLIKFVLQEDLESLSLLVSDGYTRNQMKSVLKIMAFVEFKRTGASVGHEGLWGRALHPPLYHFDSWRLLYIGLTRDDGHSGLLGRRWTVSCRYFRSCFIFPSVPKWNSLFFSFWNCRGTPITDFKDGTREFFCA